MFRAALQSILHSLFVKSGFFYYFIFPIIKKYFMMLPYWKQHHGQTVDEGGSTINVTRYDGKTFPPVSLSIISGIQNTRIRTSDILIGGYPKTGGHWAFEVLYMVRNKTVSVSKYGKAFGGFLDLIPSFLIDSIPSPRTLNSHVLFKDLPRGTKTKRTKIVLTFRNAKDTVVSYYNHNNKIPAYGYDGKFENYFKLFMEGKLEYGDFFQYYHEWANVIMTSSESDHENEIFVLSFEEQKKDPVLMIKRLAKFLDIEMTHQFAVDIANASCFDSLKKARSSDPMGSMFLRKGVVGDWQNWLDEKQEEEIDRKWKELENVYKGILDRQNGISSREEHHQ